MSAAQSKDGPGVAPQVAFVTGGASGIGTAIAAGLAEDGFDVVVTARSVDGLTAVVSRIEKAGRRTVALALDLGDQSSVERGFAEAVDRLGRVDVLVNNAAMGSLRKPIVETTREEWTKLQDVNLTGTFFMSQQLGRHLIAAGRPGAVINIASVHGLVGFAGASAYGTAKAGLIHMTRMMAIEWAPHGIRANAVAPGGTLTASRAARFDPVMREKLMKRIPLRRYAESEEVAGCVRYLASPIASFMTGQVLTLDGGVTAA